MQVNLAIRPAAGQGSWQLLHCTEQNALSAELQGSSKQTFSLSEITIHVRHNALQEGKDYAGGCPFTWLVANPLKDSVQRSIWGRGAGSVAKVPDGRADASLVAEVEHVAVLQRQQAVDAALCKPIQPAEAQVP